MLSIQAAAGAAYRGETLLNKRGRKCRIIHHLLPADGGETASEGTLWRRLADVRWPHAANKGDSPDWSLAGKQDY